MMDYGMILLIVFGVFAVGVFAIGVAVNSELREIMVAIGVPFLIAGIIFGLAAAVAFPIWLVVR